METRKVGRPSKYDPKFCEMLIEHMTQGLSYEAFAGFIGVSKQTLYTWEQNNPEFLDSKKIAVEKSRLWWEQQGQDGLWAISEKNADGTHVTKSINAAMWIFNMRNRFGWNADRAAINTSLEEGKDGKPKLVIDLSGDGKSD